VHLGLVLHVNMPFWSSKKDDGRGADSSDPRASESHDGPPADEHTRLLPNRVDSEPPYLSPDDPAVSPYNLFTIRFLRYVTIAFAAITFLWWVLELVCAFVTPPGLHTRGSGFFGFSYASVSLTILIVNLLFFAAPSKGTRILSAVLGGFLLVHMIVILAVTKIRHEEAWTGVASVIWALLMSAWVLVVDRTVQWGKKEEEERLTGRPETRRTLLEWIEVTLSSVALLVLVAVAFLLTCTLILRAVDAGLAPPGKLYWVDADKYQIHVYCYGNKTTGSKGRELPTVLFEGGEDPVEYGLWQFADNAVKNGSIGRYCFADRPGIAWVGTSSPFRLYEAAG